MRPPKAGEPRSIEVQASRAIDTIPARPVLDAPAAPLVPLPASIPPPSLPLSTARRVLALERAAPKTKGEALWSMVQALHAIRRDAQLILDTRSIFALDESMGDGPLARKLRAAAIPFRQEVGFEDDAKLPALVAELSPYVDAKGRFDVARLMRDHPTEGPILIAAMAKAPVRTNGIFGPGPEDRGLASHLSILERIDPAIGQEAIDGIWQIPKHLPAVDWVVSNVEGKPFEGYLLFGVQHLLSSQAPLFSAFEKLGIAADDIHLVGIPYSTSPMMKWFFERRGYHMADGWSGLVDDGNHQHRFHLQRCQEIEENLKRAIAKSEATGKKILVLDDGGLVSAVVAEKFAADKDRFRFVEQTTRGITEAERVHLEWPVIDVARSFAKELEMEHIARGLVRALAEQLPPLGVRDPHGVKLTMTGFGRVGAACARMLESLGFDVAIVEKDDERGRARLEEAKKEGFRTGFDLCAFAKDTRVLLGSSGHPSIDLRALELLQEGAIVGSISSAEAEIAIDELRNAAHEVGEGVRNDPFELMDLFGREDTSVRPVRNGDPHEYLLGRPDHQTFGRTIRGETQEYILNGKSLVVLNDGRPINFDGRFDNIEPEYIQATRALMLLGALEATKTDAPGIHPLPGGPEDLQTGLVSLMKRLWRNKKPKPIAWPVANDRVPRPALHGREGGSTFLEMERLDAEWNRFLGSLDEVFPRTEQARMKMRRFAYRDRDGALYTVTTGRDGPFFEPVRLPPIEGELASIRPATKDVLCVVMREADGDVREHFLARDESGRSFIEVHARRKADAAAAFASASPDRWIGFERSGDALERVMFEGAAASTRRIDLPERARKKSLFELERIAPGAIGEGTIGMVQAVEEPPAIFIRDMDMRLRADVVLPPELAEIDRISGCAFSGRILVVGKDRGGDRCVALVDTLTGGASGTRRLPEGADLKWVYFDPHARRWDLCYRPKDGLEEVHDYRTLSVALR